METLRASLPLFLLLHNSMPLDRYPTLGVVSPCRKLATLFASVSKRISNLWHSFATCPSTGAVVGRLTNNLLNLRHFDFGNFIDLATKIEDVVVVRDGRL